MIAETGLEARPPQVFYYIRSVPQLPTSDQIARAASLLRSGRLVVFPTETVYGLGASALDETAVRGVYEVKGRPATSPLIVHVASVEMARELASEWPKAATQLAQKFWPGPLTLVVRKIARVPDIVTAGLPSVGLRMPAHPVAQALLQAAQIPLAAPSANRFTELSPTTAEHVRASLGSSISAGDVDMILDGGPCAVGIESTVVSLVAAPMLLRPGGIARAEIESVIGPMQTAPEIVAGTHPAPGMHARHYSPRTPLHLVFDGKLPEKGRGVYLSHSRTSVNADPTRVKIVPMPPGAAEYAVSLYEQLHAADAAGVQWIAVDAPPETPEWEAVRDRLKRAAAK